MSSKKTELSLLRIRYAIEFMNEAEQESVVQLVELLADRVVASKEADITSLVSLHTFIKPQRYDA